MGFYVIKLNEKCFIKNASDSNVKILVKTRILTKLKPVLSQCFTSLDTHLFAKPSLQNVGYVIDDNIILYIAKNIHADIGNKKVS